MKKALVTIGAILCIGVLAVGIAGAALSSTPDEFFAARYIEICQLIFTIVVTVYVAKVVSFNVNKKTRKIDGAVRLLELIESQHMKNYRDFIAYWEKPSGSISRNIISNFKHLSILVYAFHSSCDDESKSKIGQKTINLQTSLLDFKRVATDNPFQTDNASSDLLWRRRVETGYYQFLSSIFEKRNQMYC